MMRVVTLRPRFYIRVMSTSIKDSTADVSDAIFNLAVEYYHLYSRVLSCEFSTEPFMTKDEMSSSHTHIYRDTETFFCLFSHSLC